MRLDLKKLLIIVQNHCNVVLEKPSLCKFVATHQSFQVKCICPSALVWSSTVIVKLPELKFQVTSRRETRSTCICASFALSGSVRVYTLHILFTFWLLSVCQKIIKFKRHEYHKG